MYTYISVNASLVLGLSFLSNLKLMNHDIRGNPPLLIC